MYTLYRYPIGAYVMFERYIETEEFLRLPISGNRYQVRIDGKIVDNLGNTIPTSLDSLGWCVVKLDWIKGNVFYKLAEIIAFVFKPVHLNVKYLTELSVIFADGNKENLHPSNLVWKFPVGLGSAEHRGFAFIPMYSRYMINKEGVIFDTRSKNLS